jgi:dUTP pyrophosphatase
MNSIKIKKFHELAKLPSRQTHGSAGYDLCACIPEGKKEIILTPQNMILIPTGIGIDLPIGWEAQIRPRSGLSTKNKIILINSPGTVDSDYRGEIFVPMMNLSDKDFTITNEMRIAQMVVARYEIFNWELVQELSDSDRGSGGFGSSGTH